MIFFPIPSRWKMTSSALAEDLQSLSVDTCRYYDVRSHVFPFTARCTFSAGRFGGLNKSKYISAELVPAKNKWCSISTICFLEGVARVQVWFICLALFRCVATKEDVAWPSRTPGSQGNFDGWRCWSTLKYVEVLSTREHICFARTVHRESNPDSVGKRREAENGGAHGTSQVTWFDCDVWNWKAERQHQKLLQDMEKLSFCLRLKSGTKLKRFKMHRLLWLFAKVSARGLRTRPSTAECRQGGWKKSKRRGIAASPWPWRMSLSFTKLRRSENMHLSCETCNNSKLTETSYRHCGISWHRMVLQTGCRADNILLSLLKP